MPKFSRAAQKNLSCPKFGGGLQPPSPPPGPYAYGTFVKRLRSVPCCCIIVVFILMKRIFHFLCKGCRDHLSFNLLVPFFEIHRIYLAVPYPKPSPLLAFSLTRLISMKTSDIVRKIIYVRNTCYHAVCLRPLWFYTENNCVLHVWYTKLNYKCSFYFFQQKSSSLCLSECFCNFAIHVYWT